MADELVIYPARMVRTMDSSIPTGTAVAVRGGRIRAVGELDELVRVYGPATVDDRYADKVILPGFVEAHTHPNGAGRWRWPHLGYWDRVDPSGRLWPGLKTIDAVLDRLREAEAAMTDPDEPLIAWGMDPIYYPGERLVARHLDTVSTTRPIHVQHASGHLATVNSALMKQAGIGPDTNVIGVVKDADGNPVGELQEAPAMALSPQFMGMRKFPLEPQTLWDSGSDARNHGVTTAVDIGSLLLMEDEGVAIYEAAVNAEGFPVRLSVFHRGANVDVSDPVAGATRVRELMKRSTDTLRFGLIKMPLDGTVQGWTARVQPPGWLEPDRPNGIWVIPPEQYRNAVIEYHKAGLTIHTHCNGDEATELFLDSVEEALSIAPRWNHRHTVTHSQLSTAAQYRRMAALGMCANIFSNHLWFWGDQHMDLTIGPDRAARMDAAATAIAAGVPISLHCDTPVTPIGPLLTMSTAVTRLTPSGRVIGEGERITAEQALHAMTLGSAYMIHMDHEVGSITAGKFADFAVLDDDPLAVDPVAIRDIPVHATVMGGIHHPVPTSVG